jgi:predicted permease
MQIDALLYLIITVSIGFAAKKSNQLPDAATVALPALLTNLCYPAMIVLAFSNLSISDLLSSGVTIAVATLLITIALYFIGSLILRKQERPKRILFNFILGIGNVTYVGLPLISIFFGTEGVSFAILHGVVQDVLIWLLYYPAYIGKSNRLQLRPFHNPCIAAVILGLVLTITQIELPGALTYTLEHISSVASPVALIYLGITIAKFGAWGWIRSVPAMAISVIKVLIVPLVLFCLLSFFTGRYNALLLSILFACPAPIMSIIWAEQYNGDIELSVNSCICSTLLYLVSMNILLITTSFLGWI